MSEPSAAEFCRFVQEAKEQRARADALAVALAQHREVIQKVYDYGSLSQAELDAKYPRPHVNGVRLLGAILAAAQPAAPFPAPCCRHLGWLPRMGAYVGGHHPQCTQIERQPRDQPAAGAELRAAADRLADALDQADQWLGVGPIIKSDRAEFDRDEQEFKAALADYRRVRAGLRAGAGPGREG